jgi:hypothetical protein
MTDFNHLLPNRAVRGLTRRHKQMFRGFVFVSHQIGSFMGASLGGKFYDITGNCDLMWWSAVVVGVFAACLPPDFAMTLANQIWLASRSPARSWKKTSIPRGQRTSTPRVRTPRLARFASTRRPP